MAETLFRKQQEQQQKHLNNCMRFGQNHKNWFALANIINNNNIFLVSISIHVHARTYFLCFVLVLFVFVGCGCCCGCRVLL